jgi:methylmalonyl-CoA/ethylmalonyl-CoA epimerase
MSFEALHHIGIAVPDARAAAERWERSFGAQRLEEEVLKERKLRIVWVRCGNVRIEFLEPLEGEEVVSKFLGRRGEGIHHICFDVIDAAETGADLSRRGVRLVYPEPHGGALGRKVNFVHPGEACGVLVEFSSA